jgi:hypothetical protein
MVNLPDEACRCGARWCIRRTSIRLTRQWSACACRWPYGRDNYHVETTQARAVVFPVGLPIDIRWGGNFAQICLNFPRVALELRLEQRLAFADRSRADGSPAHGAHDCKLRAYVDRVGGTCGNARCETSTAHEAIQRALSTSSGEGAQGRPEPVNTTSEIDHDDLARSGA